jgi:hypothetical protein
MHYTFEFYRIRPGDKAHATLERVQQESSDLDAAMMKVRSLFGSLDLPQKPDGVRILDESGAEVFVWNPGGH